MSEMETQEKGKKELERMTVKELKTIAAEETDLVGIHAMKKAELLAAIKAAKGIPEEKTPKKEAEKVEVTVKELKTTIDDLKKKKEEYRKARDKRMVEVLRRRINRAKKRTRKISHA
jgi:hypothetical protein